MQDETSITDNSHFYAELLRAYFDSTQDAIFVLCDEMKFLTCNKTTERWLNRTENELTLHNKRIPITRLLGESYQAETFSSFFKDALKGESISFETLIHPPRGKQRWLEVNLSRVDIESGDMVIAVARDISERKNHVDTIEHQSHHDELTGLPNRAFIIEYMDKFRKKQHKKQAVKSLELVLLVLDLDRFKEVNESFGHDYGDVILQEIARRLGRIIDASNDEFVARLGGDEFAIVFPFPDFDLSRVPIIAHMVRERVSQSIVIKGNKMSLDCAIGIASLPTHTNDSTKLIQLAEVAMYSAKSQKTGISIFNSEQSDLSSDRLQLVSDLRDALKKGQVKAFFQPIINMKDNGLHVETLARWDHPQRGRIGPDVFIQLAEESGSINKLTSVIMKSAMRNCSSLLKNNMIENLSINISPYCLTNTQLPVEIEGFLDKYGIQASKITLEITESAMMSDLSVAQQTIDRLHKLGLSFSIDDFGTGYSSLSKLKHMKLRELKIDKSFILDIKHSKDDAAITNAAIQMAHGLDLTVVAEGIENEETWQLLKEMGCDYGQGFLKAKPMPVSDLLEWILENR